MVWMIPLDFVAEVRCFFLRWANSKANRKTRFIPRRVKRSQLLDTIGRHHLPSLDVSFATPIKRVPVESESKALSCRFQHTDAFWHHLFPNAVACDDRDVESSHEATLYPFSADSNG